MTGTATKPRTTRTPEQEIGISLRLDEAKQLVPQIKAEHQAVADALESGLEHAIRCGEYLTEARKLIGHGQWAKWVEKNCEFSIRTARNYMIVFERKGELPRREETSYRQAVHMLRRDPKQPLSKKRAAPSGAKLTIRKETLTEAIETYFAYPDLDLQELLDLLKAIGVVVK